MSLEDAPPPITDEMVDRAARMLRSMGWDLTEYDGRTPPSPNLVRATRSALVAALYPDTLPDSAPIGPEPHDGA